MTKEEAKGNIIHAIRWNDMPKKEALEMAVKALEQEPCEDCISRQAIIDMTGLSEWFDSSDSYNEFVIALSELPPVTSQPKIGQWIEDENEMKVWCSECGEENDNCSKFCPNCGAKMGAESEDKE